MMDDELEDESLALEEPDELEDETDEEGEQY